MASKTKARKNHIFGMSRRRRNIFFALAAVILAAIAVIDRLDGKKHISVVKPQGHTKSQIDDFERYHKKSFVVIKVIDGDTIDINEPDDGKKYTRIRLWGIDTPETESSPKGLMYFGPEAKEFVTRTILGKTVTVYLDENNTTRDKYDRVLAYIQLEDGKYLNEILLTEGYAYADTRFKHSFYNKYKQLEALARASKKGLWKGVTREQMPPWRREE